MTPLAWLSFLAWLYLLFLHGRFWQDGPSLSPGSPNVARPVSVIVPARDEAPVIGAALRSLLSQTYPAFQVVLVDDGSTDGTGEIARAIADPRLVVIEGAERPAGWAGKLWAVHQGILATRTPWVLLTDADIVHEPAHLSTLIAHAERFGLDLVSEMVLLRCESRAERLLVPAFVYFFQLLYPFRRVNRARNRIAAAAGGTMLIRRSVLTACGGVGAVQGALIDDVALARKIKPYGAIWLGHSTMARSVRPYPTYADIWRMIARSAYVQLAYSPGLLLVALLGLSLLFVAPLAAIGLGPAMARGAGLAALLIMIATYVPTLSRYRQSALRGALLPAAALFYMAATLGSAWSYHFGSGVQWKRRAYVRGEA